VGPTIPIVEWALVVGAVVGLLAGAVAGASWARQAVRRAGRQAAPARLASKGLGRRTVDALRVGVMVLDRADHPIIANPAVRELGLVRAAGFGTQTSERPGPAIAPHVVARSLADQARRTGMPQEVELDLPRGPGQGTVGIQIRAVCLDDEYVAVEVADLTEARRLAKVRRDFVANVSHELKTPVGALHLLSEALLEATDTAEPSGPDPEAARRFAERIQHESVRMGRLVSELIELSRLQGADPLPAMEPVSVDRIVAEVIDRTRTAASAKGIEAVFVGMRGLTVYGSEDQLATALGNLVENAIAYSPDSTEAGDGAHLAGRVTVTARGDGETIEVSVIDEGIGIDAADVDRIFERFYRADQARSRATGGTGLGLAIVKHIVTNHGGAVLVNSTPGVGSTFTLRLPARPATAGNPPPAATRIRGVPVVTGPAGKD
jgi:two-component system sensor histidine kinase SenX3